MDWDTLFGPLATDALGAVTAIIPIAVPVAAALVGVTLVIATFRKFGIKR